MPTGYDVDNWRSLTALAATNDRLAKAAERCATALERLAAAFDEAKEVDPPFTDNEWAVIEAQGWDRDSMVAVLASWDPTRRTRLAHMKRVAATENETDAGGDEPLDDSIRNN